MMTSRNSWLPAVLNDQLDVSHLLVAEGFGPAQNLTEDYYIDLRDLLNYGDQFVNWAPGAAAPFVPLPEPDGDRRYATAAAAMAFFADTVNGRFLEDGVLSLVIKGRQQPRYDNLVLGKA